MDYENYDNDGNPIGRPNEDLPDPIILNGYFKKPPSSSHFNSISGLKNKHSKSLTDKTSFNIHMEASPEYFSKVKNLINKKDYPLLFDYFSSNEHLIIEYFHVYLVQNFNNINPNEFNIIEDFFSPTKFGNTDFITLIIFKAVLEKTNQNSNLTPDEFKSLLDNDFTKSFKDIYLQSQLTKYALNNFSKITEEDKSILWSKINLSLSKNSFIEKSLELNIPIIQNSFFYLDHFSHLYTLKLEENLFRYFEHAVENKWSKNVIHFIKNIPKITNSYFNKIKSIENDGLLKFERLFLYYNPRKINESHLTHEDIDLVFSKIYESIPNKDLSSKDNAVFYNSLGNSFFKFLEVAYSKEPDEVKSLLNQDNDVFFNKNKNTSSLNSGAPKGKIINNFSKTIDDILPKFQEQFYNSTFIHLMNDFMEIPKDVVPLEIPYHIKEIIYHKPCESFLLHYSIKKLDVFPTHEVNNIIHQLFSQNIENSSSYNGDFSSLANKLYCFPLSILKDFEPHLEFSMTIFKNNHTPSDYDYISQIKNGFKNIVLNKTLNENLTYKEVRNDKKHKI